MKTKRTADRSRRETRQMKSAAPLPPLRPLPEFCNRLKPGQKLTNSQHIDMLQWLLDCWDDAAVAAGWRLENAARAAG